MSPTGRARKQGRISVSIEASKSLAKINKIQKWRSANVFAGVLKDAKYADGTPVAAILNILEYGTNDGTIPSRPILRYCAATFGAKWVKEYGNRLRRGMTQEKALEQVGEIMAGDIRETFTKTNGLFAKNAPSTVRPPPSGKGFDHPLIDTGHMQRSISYEVTYGKKKDDGDRGD